MAVNEQESNQTNETDSLPELPLNEEKFETILISFIQESKINIYNYKNYSSSEPVLAYRDKYYPQYKHYVYHPEIVVNYYKALIPKLIEELNYPTPDWNKIIEQWRFIYSHYNEDENEYPYDMRTPISSIIRRLVDTEILNTTESFGIGIVHSIITLCLERLCIPDSYYQEVKEFVLFELNERHINYENECSSCHWIERSIERS